MNELLERAKAGDIDSYSKLMALLRVDMEKVANKTLIDKSYVDDVLQSVYYKMYKKLDTLKENDKFRSWVLTAVKHDCLNINKYIARHREVSINDFENMLYDTSTNNFEDSLNFEQMISDLTEEEKILLRLKYKENYKSTEIAEELGIPYNTVKSKINRAIKKITLVALILVMLSGFTVLATFIIKQIRAHFTTSLNAINTAVENDYVQEIDSDFVYDNGIGIKVDAIILDDKNLDISFVYDVQDKEKYGEITGIGLDDYVIKSGDEVLFDSRRKIIPKSEMVKQISNEFEEIDEYYRNSILFSTVNDFTKIEELIIDVKSILINIGEDNFYNTSGKWNLRHNVESRFNERISNTYTIENNLYVENSEVLLIDTAIQFEIEFIEEIDINVFDITLYNSDEIEFNWVDGKFFKDKKLLKVNFDVGKYTDNIEELTLEIPTSDNENIILKFRKDQ